VLIGQVDALGYISAQCWCKVGRLNFTDARIYAWILENRPESADLSVGTYCAQNTSGIVYQNDIFPANDGRQAKPPFRTLSFVHPLFLPYATPRVHQVLVAVLRAGA
jgi:hypothetical protein